MCTVGGFCRDVRAKTGSFVWVGGGHGYALGQGTETRVLPRCLVFC